MSAAEDDKAGRWDGRVLLLLAVVLWSTSGFFAKAPVFDGWPKEVEGWPVRGPLLAFWRTVFASVILLPLVRRPRWNPKMIPAMLIFAAMNVTYLTAMTKTTAANAIWLQNTAPVWVFLAGVMLFGEPVHRRDWWLLAFAVSGVGLILSFELRGQAPDGMVYGLLSGLTYAGVVLSLRLLRDQDSAWLVAMNHVATAVLLLPYVWYWEIWPTAQQLGFVSAFGMFQMGLPYWLFARGVRSVTAHEAIGLTLLEPILVPIWVYLAWRHEPSYQAPAWWTLAGGGLILTGLLCRYLPWRGLLRQYDQLRSEAEEGDR